MIKHICRNKVPPVSIKYGQGGIFLFAIFLIILSCGVWLGFLYIANEENFRKHFNVIPKNLLETEKNKATTNNITQFEFYTLLADGQRVVEPAATTTNPSPAKEEYILQVAALIDQKKADQLKNQLMQQHYPAFISRNQTTKVTWYRILIGPYSTLESAQNARERLNQSGLKSLLFKLADRLEKN